MKRFIRILVCMALVISMMASAAPESFSAKAESFNITVEMADANWGSVTGGGTIEAGHSVTIKANTVSPYRFICWTDRYGVVVSVDPQYTFTPTGDGKFTAWAENAVSAVYRGAIEDVVFDTVSEGYGTIAYKPAAITNTGSGKLVFKGSDVTLGGADASAFELNCPDFEDISPDHTDNSFVRVRPRKGLQAGTYKATVTVEERDYYINPLTANISFTVTADYVINTNVSPAGGGSVTGAGTYSSGNTVTLTATPNPKFVFDSWYEGSSKLTTSPSYSFTVSSARNLTAKFRQVIFDIAVESDNTTMGTVAGAGSYSEGSSVTITATPKPGFRFDCWIDQYGIFISYNAEHTFTPSKDSKYIALFAAESEPQDISFSIISDIPDQPYTGSAITPGFTVTFSDVVLIKDTDYTVSYSNNIEIGTATVTVTGIGNYKGTVTGSFKIIDSSSSVTTPQQQPSEPAEKITLSKIKSVKLTALSAKKLKVSWKKLSSKDQKKIQKIQIQYSTDKTFKTYKTKWAKKGASSAKISGLKKNTKYYIRIRAYKKSGGVVYVSKWVIKNKKTKKK